MAMDPLMCSSSNEGILLVLTLTYPWSHMFLAKKSILANHHPTHSTQDRLPQQEYQSRVYWTLSTHSWQGPPPPGYRYSPWVPTLFSSPMFSNEWIEILKMVIFHVLMWVLSMTPMRTNSPLCLSMHTKIRYLTMICALNLAQIRCQMPWSRYLLWSNPTITTKKISHHWRWCDNFSHFIWGCFSTLWQIHCPPLD